VSARSRARVASRRALFVRPLVRSLALLRIVPFVSPSFAVAVDRAAARRDAPQNPALGARARASRAPWTPFDAFWGRT